ncbi:unnamed protein product, partial [Urochloa humidicola]
LLCLTRRSAAVAAADGHKATGQWARPWPQRSFAASTHGMGSWQWQVLKPSRKKRCRLASCCQNLSWGYPGIAIYRAELDYIPIINLVMCKYIIQINVVLNMVLVLLVICDYASRRVRGDTLSLSVYSEE